MTWLIHFGLGMILSFIGSIPFGTINVATAETAIRQGFRAAVWVALGAALIEWIQALISLKFARILAESPWINEGLTWASIPVFIGLGIYFLRRGKRTPKQLKTTRAQGFLKGVIVSSLNLLAFPYWIFYAIYLSSLGLIDLDDHLLIGVFSLGVLCGTILILLTYARIGIYASSKSRNVLKYLAPTVAVIFFILALIQAVRAVSALV
ncbi:MAG: LysE family transporter [Saprospiraceae bacterium]|nr:LysE family transporter [Saprospiraceae bacterium]